MANAAEAEGLEGAREGFVLIPGEAAADRVWGCDGVSSGVTVGGYVMLGRYRCYGPAGPVDFCVAVWECGTVGEL